MSLDSRTRRGRNATKLGMTAVAAFCGDEKTFIVTDQSQPAAIDAVAVRDGAISDLIEAKVRFRGISLFELRQGKSVILDESKIVRGLALSKMLRAPFVFLCYLYHDGVVAVFTLSSYSGAPLIEYKVTEERTRKTINDPARRTARVAHLYLKDAKIIEIAS